MQRREFLASLKRLAGSVGALPLAAAPLSAFAVPRRLLLQTSPVAGFQYHKGEAAWPRLRVGLPLTLRREPGNRYDTRAIEVWAGTHKLGYVPRTDNCATSQLMDRGERLAARIVALEASADPWRRVQFEIHLENA